MVNENKSPSPFAKWDKQNEVTNENKSKDEVINENKSPSPFAKWDKLPDLNNPVIKYTDKYKAARDQLTGNVKDNSPKIDENTEWGEVLKTGLSQVPNSSFRLLRDVVNTGLGMFTGETEKGLYNIAKGVGKYALSSEGVQPKELDSMVNFMKDRYGTLGGFKKAIALDPVGVLSDLSTVIIPAGGALKQAGKIGSLGNKTGKLGKLGKVSKTGDFIMKGAAYADPMTYLGKALSATIKRGHKGSYPGYVTTPTKMVKKGVEQVPILGKALTKPIEVALDMRDPRSIMKNNLKMKGLDEAATNRMIDLAMEKELYPTARSGKIVQKLIDAEESKLNAAVKKHAKKEINTKDYRYFTDKNTIDKRAVDDIAQKKAEIKNLTGANGYRKKVTVSDAKALLDDLNEQFKDVTKDRIKSEMGANPNYVKINTLKEFKNGVARTIYKAVPELKNINPNMKELVAFKNALTEATNKTTKETLYSAVSLVKDMAIAGPKGGMFGLVKGIFNTPKVKVAYAQLLNKLEKNGKKIKPTKQAIALGLILPERTKPKDKDNIQP